MIDIQKEREAFEAIPRNARVLRGAKFQDGEYVALSLFDESSKELAAQLNYGWSIWQAAKAQAIPDGFVVVPKGQTEDWYLDPNDHMWYEQDGIDDTLSYMDIGEVTAIEHKEYLITESNMLYAAIVWDDSNDQVGFWELFKTKEEAEKAAAHCKAMVEAAKGGNNSKHSLLKFAVVGLDEEPKADAEGN